MDAQREFYSRNEDFARETLHRLAGDVSGSKILDLGCGIGDDLEFFQSQGADVVGIDSSEAMIELAYEYNPKVALKMEKADLTDLPFGESQFDIVVSRYAFHYASDLPRATREVYRVLRPGGLAIHVVAHPLIGFVLKGSTRYFEAEVVTLPLYKQIFVTEPSRTFTDYINADVLSLFELEAFEEGHCPDGDRHENEFKQDISDFLALKFKKRA